MILSLCNVKGLAEKLLSQVPHRIKHDQELHELHPMQLLQSIQRRDMLPTKSKARQTSKGSILGGGRKVGYG